ncbi:hypothetical protein BDV18DRAFT_137504 [Aspergillus unguis]
MALETNPQTHRPKLTRWYIDTRNLTNSHSTLTLLWSLRIPDQVASQRFYHLKDKHMSLASNLLKYLYIHRTCRIPWEAINISRTADPHRRPCYIPDLSKLRKNEPLNWQPVNVEFNVSHQAGMVALVGTPTPLSPTSGAGTQTEHTKPQVGVDITCVNERKGGKEEDRKLSVLREFVDIFSEVFSPGEIAAMKRVQVLSSGDTSTTLSDEQLVEYGYRLFYTYWALKEAYIKMTGEALLAPWLRELEFSNVVAPGPESGDEKFGEPYKEVKTTLRNKLVEDVRIEVAALEADYLFATAARGDGIGPTSPDCQDEDSWLPFTKIDFERDIRPCAEERCNCLTEQERLKFKQG